MTTRGVPKTRKLFIQFDPEGEYDLDEWRKVFVDIADPTEYDAAITLIGSWDEWKKLKQYWPWFRDVCLPAWLEEVEIKLRSQAVKHIIKQSKKDNGTAAARWVAEGRYACRKPGKPTNAEIERQARIHAGVEEEVADDIERVRLVSNNDGN